MTEDLKEMGAVIGFIAFLVLMVFFMEAWDRQSPSYSNNADPCELSSRSGVCP